MPQTASTSERSRQWHTVHIMYFLIYGTGSSYAHAYYVILLGINDELKKWRLGKGSIFENCNIVEMRLRKWSGFYV